VIISNEHTCNYESLNLIVIIFEEIIKAIMILISNFSNWPSKNLNRNGMDKRAFPKCYLWIRWKFIHSDSILTSVCTAPWCRCVTPLPGTFLFIYWWLVTFSRVARFGEHRAWSISTRVVFCSLVELPPEKKQQLFPQPTFRLFYALIISLLLSRTCSCGVCVRNTVPLPLTSR